MTLRLNGSTSGYTEIDAPAVAGNNTVLLPAGNGSANQFLKNGTAAGTLGWSSMVETATGVGIGTASPTSLLHVTNSSGAAAFTIGSTTNTSELQQNGADLYISNYTAGGSAIFRTGSGTERMRISSGGNVLINRTSQTAGERFAVYADVLGGNTAYFWYGQTDDRTNVVMRHDRSTGGTSARQISFCRQDATEVGHISSTGTATAYNTSSDYRLKENVIPVTDGITRLQQLKPSRFNFIADPETTVDGFIAHEVQAVVPEAISGEKDAVDKDGNPVYQGIDQSKLVPLLTAALQEAIGRIESLEVANADLAARLTALEVTP